MEMWQEAGLTRNRVEEVYMCLKQRRGFVLKFNSVLKLNIPEKT